MKDFNRIRYFWVGFGVGAAATALLAPKSGAEVRNLCQTKAHKTANVLRRQAGGLRNRAVTMSDRRRAQVKQQLNKIAAAMDAGKRAYKQAS